MFFYKFVLKRTTGSFKVWQAYAGSSNLVPTVIGAILKTEVYELNL